jgi:hypothetical protein
MNKEGQDAFLALLKATASKDRNEAEGAKLEMASALADVLRDGIMSGDIVRGLYQVDPSGGEPKYPLSFLAPGTEHLHRAYTMPSVGMIPRRQIEGDFVTVPIFKIANSIDWSLDYAKDANWFVVRRALQVLQSGFDKKINDDGWHTIIAAATDRNIIVYDADANAGQFTKRLVSLMKTVFARNAGGNSASLNKKILTDLAMSLEGQEDIRNWGVDQLDDITRNQIYNAGDNSDRLMRIFGVNLHPLYELGENQEYQKFFTDKLGGSLQGSDLELVIGMDLRPDSNTFVMPLRDDVEVFNDGTLHREGLDGYYGWARLGFSVLDSRDVILGSF